MRRDSGFAIGSILLAVVLVAAVVISIAVSTTTSSANADAEEQKIEESAILYNIQQLLAGAKRYDAVNGGRGQYVVSDVTAGTGMTVQTLIDEEYLPQSFEVLPGIPATSESGIWALGPYFRMFFILVENWDDAACRDFNEKWQDGRDVYSLSQITQQDIDAFDLDVILGQYANMAVTPGNIFCGMHWNYRDNIATYALVVSI